MRFTNITAFAAACCLALPGFVFAQETTEEPVEAAAEESSEPELTYRTGDVELPNKIATLHLGSRFRYLDPAETEKLLVRWNNPPGSETQGAVVPASVEPFSDAGWAVILTYEDEGHIDDAEAAEIDYDDMLKDMKADTEEKNEQRKDAGYAAVHLVGWAEKPRYDATSKKLYWAQELNFEGSENHTLNYEVRVLGREGVRSMNAVASMTQLAQIRSDMGPLIRVAEFNQGQRYADYNPKTDRLAEYGLGALIAGTVAGKLGLFAKLGAFLLLFKKVIFGVVVALGAGLFKFFGKKKDQTI
ncbi:MAG: DUF2167 domain-containing protein [Steroidobacteraceae bacterium]|nr:DUF2167 domain-containing protein [Steroidobacteraceae bacterium]